MIYTFYSKSIIKKYERYKTDYYTYDYEFIP